MAPRRGGDHAVFGHCQMGRRLALCRRADAMVGVVTVRYMPRFCRSHDAHLGSGQPIHWCEYRADHGRYRLPRSARRSVGVHLNDWRIAPPILRLRTFSGYSEYAQEGMPYGRPLNAQSDCERRPIRIRSRASPTAALPSAPLACSTPASVDTR